MNIYVGNLSWSMTSEDLENLFTPFGAVASAKIVTDKFNNNRTGWTQGSYPSRVRAVRKDSEGEGRRMVSHGGGEARGNVGRAI